MRRNRKRIHIRTMVAIALISSSFLSAYVLSSLANRTQLLWSVRTPLVEGSRVSATDLVARRVALPDGDTAYISAQRDITHFLIVKSVGVGELVPASAVSQSSDTQSKSAVPINIHAADIPANLLSGEPINLYHVGDPHLGQETRPPNLIISHAYILGIDRKAQNLGGDMTLTISVSANSVLRVLAATSTGRLVVVRVHG